MLIFPTFIWNIKFVSCFFTMYEEKKRGRKENKEKRKGEKEQQE
jgi:hypothetical protein